MKGLKNKFSTITTWHLVLLMLCALLNTQPSQAIESVCAEVKIEIKQELTLERQGFDAHMRINNGLDSQPLDNVSISVNFFDDLGNPVLASSDPNNTDAKFFIRIDTLDGITDVDGFGQVQPQTSADIHWLIIPAPGAGGQLSSGTLYLVGATLSYTLGGEETVMEVSPDSITVKPMPLLTLDYFLTEEVYADDAFTPEIEPAEPFTLGVRVSNNGNGLATDVKIESAQPKIIENEQGLLIGFEIIGSTVNEQPSTPSLLVNLGDILPNEATVGRWIMETSLSGKFTEFSAEFAHADELGGELTSLLDATNAHILIRDVLVDLPGRDNIRDFLAKDDAGAITVYESDTVDTTVIDQSTFAILTDNGNDGSQYFYDLQMPTSVGFTYVKLPDPNNGILDLTRVIRSDGKVINPNNVWLSRTRNKDTLLWEHYINFFDANTTGSYNVVMGVRILGEQPPVLQFIADKDIVETNQVSFVVQSTDPNGDDVILFAENLPDGANFVDQGGGQGYFDWTPEVGQAGTYVIIYKASDGTLETSRTANIFVKSLGGDSDNDGLPDAWEIAEFGNLDRDGKGDFDGDGVPDELELFYNVDPDQTNASLQELTISLKKGPQIIGVPGLLVPKISSYDLLQQLGTAIHSISRYNTTTQLQETTYWDNTNPAGPDFYLWPNEGYFVQMTEPTDLVLTPFDSNKAIPLQTGINVIGLTDPTGDAFGLLDNLGSDLIWSIRRLNPITALYETAAFDDVNKVGVPFPMRTGEGYIVTVKQDASL